MKKKNIISVLVAALLILAVLFVAFIIPRVASESFRAKNDISKYLRAVEKGNYDRAVKYVDLDDGLSADEWIERISSLADKSIYLYGYENLEVKVEDGKPTATVTLLINDLGHIMHMDYKLELKVEDIGIFGIKYKIYDVTDEEVRLEIEDALSGIDFGNK